MSAKHIVDSAELVNHQSHCLLAAATVRKLLGRRRPLRHTGLEKRLVSWVVGASRSERATTCTPTMPAADAPGSTGRTESQGLGITGAPDAPWGAQGAPAAWVAWKMGRIWGAELPRSEAITVVLEELGSQIAEAVARPRAARNRDARNG